MAEQKEESKKEPTEEYAGLGKEVFVCKKEDFEILPSGTKFLWLMIVQSLTSVIGS